MNYTPCIGLVDLPPRETLREAFEDFYHAMNAKMDEPGTLPLAYLSTCWINGPDDTLPLGFDELVTFANDHGWLRNGKLVEGK